MPVYLVAQAIHLIKVEDELGGLVSGGDGLPALLVEDDLILVEEVVA